MKFYLSERCFKIKQEDDYSDLKEIVTGLPQVIVLVRWVTEILGITEFNFLKMKEFKKRSTKNQVEITKKKKKMEYLRNHEIHVYLRKISAKSPKSYKF